MGIARSTALKAIALPSKMLYVLIILSLLGPAAPVLARDPFAVASGTPAAQVGNRLTEQPAASQLTQPAAPVTAAAQPPVALQGTQTTTVFLPLVFGPRQSNPPQASPYAVALSKALADCAGTTLNQVCYARGSVTLVGGGPLTTPGQVATLDGVSGLTLVSPDVSHWSVALVRLAADSPTPDLGLTLLAFGNVEIRNLTLFHAAAANGDVAPALSFSSSPVPGQDPVTGGIIVYNPSHEEPLSISLNGADLTLASSAVIGASRATMSVIMSTGSALVHTAAGDGALLQSHQLSVPLDRNGKATGAPTTPTMMDDNRLKPIAPTDERDPLATVVPRPSRQDIKGIIDAMYYFTIDAYDRCMAGNSRQVYRMMYYARILQYYASLYPNILTDSLMGDYDKKLRQCATFEIEFNSVISVTSPVDWGSMYIQGQGMIVSYGMDGNLVQMANMPLTHRRYDITFAMQQCLNLVITDGVLFNYDGYMRINHNRLNISTTMTPVGIWEHTIFTCYDPPVEMANPALWQLLFDKLHRSEFIETEGSYRFTEAHWKYTGNHILAEAIFDRKVIDLGGMEVDTGNTWLVMLHKPGG